MKKLKVPKRDLEIYKILGLYENFKGDRYRIIEGCDYEKNPRIFIEEKKSKSGRFSSLTDKNFHEIQPVRFDTIKECEEYLEQYEIKQKSSLENLKQASLHIRDLIQKKQNRIKMKKYKVHLPFCGVSTWQVEARTKKEAIQKAKEGHGHYEGEQATGSLGEIEIFEIISEQEKWDRALKRGMKFADKLIKKRKLK